MPNHVSTLLTITGDDATIAACLARHVVPRDDGKGSRFALDSIIPMPQSVLDTARPMPWDDAKIPPEARNYGGDATVEMRAQCMLMRSEFVRHPFAGYSWIPSSVATWAQLADHIDARYPGARFWARRALLAAAETDYSGWYEWSRANWGTKWDAYEYKPRARSDGSAAIKFETAWAPPTPCLRRLSELWPTLTFEVESIDEGGPEYAGRFVGGKGDLARADDDEARYERVYGRKRPRYDDDGEEIEEPAQTTGALS